MDDYDRLKTALDEHRNHACPVFAAAALVLPEMKRLMERIAELEDENRSLMKELDFANNRNVFV